MTNLHRLWPILLSLLLFLGGVADHGVAAPAEAQPSIADPCPLCGGALVKAGSMVDDRSLPSRNLAVWNRSICANTFYGRESLICSRCLHAYSADLKLWERASEDAKSFRTPLVPVIAAFPLPSANVIKSRIVYRQSYKGKRLSESVSFWCADVPGLVAPIRQYCKAHQLTLRAEAHRDQKQMYVSALLSRER